MRTINTVDEFVTELACGLRGPGRWRRRVVDEMADGLSSTVDSYAEHLADRDAAERRALAEWGSAAALVAEFNKISRRLRISRLAVRILWVVPPLAMLWASVLILGPRAAYGGDTAVIRVGPEFLGGGVLLALVSSLVILFTHRGRYQLVRQFADRWADGMAGLACGGMLVAVATLLVLLVYRLLIAPTSISWSLFSVPLAITFGMLYLTGRDLYGVLNHNRMTLA